MPFPSFFRSTVHRASCTSRTIKSKVKGSGRGRPLYACMPTKVGSTFVDFPFVPWTCDGGVGSEGCAATGAALFIGAEDERRIPRSLSQTFARLRAARNDNTYGQRCGVMEHG